MTHTTTRSIDNNPAFGAFAKSAIRALAVEGWHFVSLEAGVIKIEHPAYGRLEFDNDNYAVCHVAPDTAAGLYADAIFSLDTTNDDGEFQRALAREAGSESYLFVPLYDRHLSCRHLLDPDPASAELEALVARLEARGASVTFTPGAISVFHPDHGMWVFDSIQALPPFELGNERADADGWDDYAALLNEAIAAPTAADETVD